MIHQAPIDVLSDPAAEPDDLDPSAPSPSTPSVPQLVSEILRRQGRSGQPSPNPTERAAVGAAISILGACLADETIGPLPRLTSGLLEIVLAPEPAVE